MRRLVSLAALGLLLWCSSASAQTVRELSLAEAISIAQGGSKEWAQFDAREESAKAQYKIAESHWWPILSVDSSLLLWSDAAEIEVMDKEEVKKNFQGAMQNLDITKGLTEEDKAALALAQQKFANVAPLLEMAGLSAAELQSMGGAFKQMAGHVGGSLMQQLSDPLLGSIPESIKLKDNFTFTIGATLKMPLTPLFKVYQAGKLAQVGIDNIGVERRAKALSISYEVTEVYLKLVYAQLMHEVAQEALETIEKHVEMAQKYEAVGMISHSDVLSAEVEQLKAKQNVVEARNATRLAGMKLAQVLSLGRGVEVRALDMPQDAYDVSLGELEEYQQQAIENRTELERIGLGKEAAERRRKMALLDYVPQIALVGSYQYAYGLDILEPSNQGLIGLMMSWTIFDGLGHYYEAQKASMEAAELESKSDQARELIELEVAQKYLALETALERVQLTRQALALAEENLRTITAQFAAGESVNTDVLTAQTRHTAARADDVKARIDILIALAGLKLSLGADPALEPAAFR